MVMDNITVRALLTTTISMSYSLPSKESTVFFFEVESLGDSERTPHIFYCKHARSVTKLIDVLDLAQRKIDMSDKGVSLYHEESARFYSDLVVIVKMFPLKPVIWERLVRKLRGKRS